MATQGLGGTVCVRRGPHFVAKASPARNPASRFGDDGPGGPMSAGATVSCSEIRRPVSTKCNPQIRGDDAFNTAWVAGFY